MTNDPMTLVRWLTAGAGIAYVPLMWVIDGINRGELEILLPRYQSIHARFMRYIPKR
ncbi:hypothetical protein ACVXHA_10590 [Escherichia coli]